MWSKKTLSKHVPNLPPFQHNVFWLSTCSLQNPVSKLDLLQIYDAFINTSLLVEQESVIDMCRYLFFEAWHPRNGTIHLGIPKYFSHWFFHHYNYQHWTVSCLPSRSSHLSGFLVVHVSRDLRHWGSKMTLKWTGGNEENSERFSRNGCISRSRLRLLLGFLPPRTASRLSAAALLVQFDLVLEAVVQFKVVVLKGGGGAWRQAAVGAGAVQEEAGADRPEQDAQGAHDDDGDQDGVQGVQPRVVLLWDTRHRRLRWRGWRVPLGEL